MEKISKPDLARLYLRSFFVQAGWNYERMIALGFTWILLPLMEKLYPAKEEKKRFLERHLSTFNANPYLAPYAVGAVAKLEEAGASAEEIGKFKNSLRGPLGALGDNLIWMNLRPALLILGIILVSTVGAFGALIFWLLYNIHQIYLRARGLFKGYGLGLGVASDHNISPDTNRLSYLKEVIIEDCEDLDGTVCTQIYAGRPVPIFKCPLNTAVGESWIVWGFSKSASIFLAITTRAI